MRSAFLLILGIAVVVLAVPAGGAPPTDADMLAAFPHPKGYVCYRTTSPITIDGALADAAWDAAPWTDAFVDIEGDKQPKPRFRTRVKMLWDDEALYIAAELEEPHVWATLTEHDSVIFHDNDFEVFLDPDGDNHLYGELELNALNTTWDLLLTKPYKDGGKAVNAWEITGLKTAVKINGTLNDPRDKDTGWTLEIKWPWKGLKELSGVAMPPKDGDQWRINFSRVEWDIEIVGRQVSKGEGQARVQLGLVAAGSDRHASPGAVGLSAVQHGEAGNRGVPGPTPTGPFATSCTAPTTPSAITTRRTASTRRRSPTSVWMVQEARSCTSRRSAPDSRSPPTVTRKGDAKPRRLTITQDARISATVK